MARAWRSAGTQPRRLSGTLGDVGYKLQSLTPSCQGIPGLECAALWGMRAWGWAPGGSSGKAAPRLSQGLGPGPASSCSAV